VFLASLTYSCLATLGFTTESRWDSSDRPTVKTTRHKSSARPAPSHELVELRARLADAEETLRAIRSGEVDALVVAGKQGPQVFTLEGAEHAYRMLIEYMTEGALILTADGVILYANQSFAQMVKHPLEQVLGSSFHRVLSVTNQDVLRPLLKRTVKSGFHIQALLHAGDGSQLPARISSCPLAKNGSKTATFGIVVTDMTETRRNEEMLRALTQRVVEAQEAERRLVALELHDHITQYLCAVLLRWQALANQLPAREEASRGEVRKISEMLGQTVEEVQRIARNLRPSILDELGLVPGLQAACSEFAERTGVSLKLACAPLTGRLPAEVELALYRIFQKALENVEKHARARHVTVRLTKEGGIVQLTIIDDGIGFDPDQPPARRKKRCDLGLLRMRERATYVGGDLKIKSIRRARLHRSAATGRGLGGGPAKAGTQIEVRIPLPPGRRAAK
jgi:PAS domain S-box-containing protein